jgi:hypothetical protein
LIFDPEFGGAFKNAVHWDVPPCDFCKTDIPKEIPSQRASVAVTANVVPN